MRERRWNSGFGKELNAPVFVKCVSPALDYRNLLLSGRLWDRKRERERTWYRVPTD